MRNETDEAEPGAEEVLPVAKGKTTAANKKKVDVLSGTVPEWANSTAIAQLLGKTVRRVQQLSQEGVLPTETPPGGGAKKYRTCETIQRYIAHVERKAQEAGESGRQAELSLKKLEAEVALKESQGELHMLKTDIAKGRYLRTEDVADDMAEFMATFKKFALTIPNRMAGAMAAYTDSLTARSMEKSMRKEVEAMLTVFADAAIPDVPAKDEQP